MLLMGFIAFKAECIELNKKKIKMHRKLIKECKNNIKKLEAEIELIKKALTLSPDSSHSEKLKIVAELLNVIIPENLE